MACQALNNNTWAVNNNAADGVNALFFQHNRQQQHGLGINSLLRNTTVALTSP